MPNVSPVITADAPVPYRLVMGMRDQSSLFGLRPRRVPTGRAMLSSPLLDPVMHHGGSVLVTLASLGPSRDPVAAVDSFELASVAAYLAAQADVRRALERELDTHLAGWGEAEFGRGAGVWRAVRISTLSVGPRRVKTRAEAAALVAALAARSGRNVDEAHVDRILAMADTPATRSRFAVDLDADWDDGHARTADFRDAALLVFSVE